MKKYSLIVFFILSIQIVNCKVLYVSQNGNDNNDGLSWETAFATLQHSIDIAMENDEIWVAEGIYIPTKAVYPYPDIRYKAIQMKNNVAIYGGFPNKGEPTFEDRDWIEYPTILSGLLEEINGETINAYHVIFNTEDLNLNNSAILDGFVIQDGFANGSFLDFSDSGAGMLNKNCEPHIINCIFQNNTAAFGAGVYNYESNPTFENCKFISNHTYGFGNGAAMYNNSGNPIVLRCEFTNNKATHGGAVYNTATKPLFQYCIFEKNEAKSGAAVYNNNKSNVKFLNTIFNHNISSYQSFNEISQFGGGAMYNMQSLVLLVNCLIHNNKVVGVGLESGGGAMYNMSSDITFVNCTVTNNLSEISGDFLNGGAGGGLLNIDTDVSFKNSILWGNISHSEGNDAYNYGFSVRMFFNYSCFSDKENDIVTIVEYVASNSINADPRLMDFTEPPYMFDHTSPAADAGNNSYITHDYFPEAKNFVDVRGPGHQRILGKMPGKPSIVDMGAFEYHYGYDPVSVLELQNSTEFITIYPNPSIDVININYFNEFHTNATIELYTLNGSLCLLQKEIELIEGDNNIQIESTNLNSGFYIINLRLSNGNKLVNKVIIQ